MNAYEKSIRSYGDIEGYYDADQLFPVYGYGAILPNENQVSHIFPINGNPDLVEASYLPISVIIIGIVYNDFENMDILVFDENPLFDKNGRKADRDLVQIVPFYKFSNSDGNKLAEQILEEVPR